jgi:hypothetical protein
VLGLNTLLEITFPRQTYSTLMYYLILWTYVLLKSIIFWDITPCSPLSVNRCFRGTYRLHLQGWRNKFSKKPASKQATLKMEAICSSKTLVDTQRTRQHYIPEPQILHMFYWVPLIHSSKQFLIKYGQLPYVPCKECLMKLITREILV